MTIEKIFLKIADINFRINFHPAKGEFFRAKLKKDIIESYSGFIEKKLPEKIDFTIDIAEKDSIEIILKRIKGAEVNFINISEIKKSKNLKMSYQSSFFHFQYLLKKAILQILSAGDGFILHSSTNNFNGKCILFLGKSGAGKSTAMTLLSSKYDSVSDDTIIVRKKNGKFSLYQTPFIETNYRIRKNNNKLGISKLFFLKKSKEFKIEEIKDKQKVLNLLLELIWAENSFSEMEIKLIADFIRKNQFYILYFSKNKEKMISLIENYEKK